VYRIEGDEVRHIMQLTEKLFSAEKPTDDVLEQKWDGLECHEDKPNCFVSKRLTMLASNSF
jgi:hypothetical protein